MGWFTIVRAGLALLAAAGAVGGAAAEERATLIRGARLFDGTGAPAVPSDVLIRAERIVAVGTRLRAPRGSRTIDARGLTLLPGLHDLHTHMRADALGGPDDLGKAYAGHLTQGVTTAVDFSMSGEMIAPVRDMTASGAVAAPALRLAIRIGVPGGHGTESGWGPFQTMEAPTPRAAALAMARALPYRPDVIKVFADGWRYGRTPDLNSMNLPTLAAIVKEAHAKDVPVITHTVTLAGAKIAAAAGVDALGHGIGDALVDDELIRLMKANGTAYVPTMVVYEPQQDRRFAPHEWRALRPQERAREEARLAVSVAPIPELESRRWTILRENLRRLRAAGVRVGIGTDAGIRGVYHGSSAVRETVILTRNGFTPAEALVAATSAGAAILRQADAGRIAVGERADLVLTGGRPDERIEDLHDVRRVFVGGREAPLARLGALLATDAPSPLPSHRMAGPIDTGAGPSGRTDLDTLPVESYEPGADHSELEHARVGGSGEARIMLVGRMGASPQPFSQLEIPLTKGAVQLADASGFEGIAFTARGSGRYRLLLDVHGIDDGAAFCAPFEALAEAGEVRIPFDAFRSPDPNVALDAARLRALAVRLEGEPGARSWLEIGQVRFYRRTAER
jgi:imidazolonepropionase-like amidohydrolase